jgi:hypothetical protein
MTDDEVVAFLMSDAGSPPAGDDQRRLDRTRTLLGDPSTWAEPSPDLEQRVLDAVAAVARPPRADQPSPALDDQPQVIPLAPRRAARHWVRSSLLGAAAAILLAVGVATVISSQRDHPVQFAAAMTGTELAPAAKGSVTMTQTASGWRIHLQAKGLPRLDNGAFYQGWLKDAAGTLVPIGTFNQADDVTLWAGVPPSSYPTITITRQEATGGPASSGQKVLVGTSHRTG